VNWSSIKACPWVDTRAYFVARVPPGGCLLDLGASDGETLGHMAELRPDLKLRAADICGKPERYPAGCDFARVDLEREPLPWATASADAITCMHLVEHLRELEPLMREVARVLKPGGRVYFETPHPRTTRYASPAGAAAGTFTMNFYDDPTHVQLVSAGRLGQLARNAGLKVITSGVSRNWLFAFAWLWLWPAPPSRKKFTAQAHWRGWSAYLIAERPA
jgi:SAM-dependent methyltransferase